MEKVLKKLNISMDAKLLINKAELQNFYFAIFGFLFGRVWIFQSFNPIVICFLSLLIFRNSRFFLIATFSILGIVSSMLGDITYKYIISIAFLIVLDKVISAKPKVLAQSIITAMVFFISSVVSYILAKFNFYYIVTTLIESFSIVPLVLVLKKGLSVFEGRVKRRILTSEEIISISIFLGSLVVGASGIYIFNLSLREYFISLIILIFAYSGGVSQGALSGMFLGLMLLFTSLATSDIVIILSISGICAGISATKNKIIKSFLFIISRFTATFFLNPESANVQLLINLGLASLTFLFLKENFYYYFRGMINVDMTSEKDFAVKIKEITRNRLDNFSKVLLKLSNTFEGNFEMKTSLNKNDINNITDDIRDVACKDCPLNKECWKNNFFDTYQSVFIVMNIFESKGSLEPSDIPVNFFNKCTNLNFFIDTTKNIFEIYKLNLIWENKVSESRELIATQLGGISEAIEGLSNEINYNILFLEDLENKIKDAFVMQKIPVKSVMAIENKNNRLEIYLKFSNCFDNNCWKDSLKIINDTTNKKMRKEMCDCNNCKIKFMEEESFKTTSAIAKTSKDNSDTSGDSYSYSETDTGEIILALADGMGSGAEARKESMTAIELLEELLEASIKRETAIEMINSMLVLRNKKETFSTLDICIIDSYTGKAEFIKIGASSTFLIRDERVQVIKSTTLPMGVFNRVDSETYKRALKDNDIIVMVTDGVLEIDDLGFNKEKWVVEYLEKLKTNNPEHIARKLLDKAKEISRGRIKDDMTILVVKIWETY